jgi:hypothetical protein
MLKRTDWKTTMASHEGKMLHKEFQMGGKHTGHHGSSQIARLNTRGEFNSTDLDSSCRVVHSRQGLFLANTVAPSPCTAFVHPQSPGPMHFLRADPGFLRLCCVLDVTSIADTLAHTPTHNTYIHKHTST